MKTGTKESLSINVKNEQLETDHTLQETRPHGTDSFPFQFYNDSYDWKKKSCVDWHWHKELEILVLRSEALVCKAGDQVLHLKQGDCILLNSGVIHRYEAPEDTGPEEGKWHSILFSSDMIAPVNSVIYQKTIAPVINSGICCFNLSGSDEWHRYIRSLTEQILDICLSGQKGAELSIHILLCRIWKELYIHFSEFEKPGSVSSIMTMQARQRLMLQYIWENYSRPILLKDIAASANLSTSVAQRCFRTCVKDSPIHYLQRFRLEHAKKLLLTSRDSILEIALSSGFGSSSAMDHFFKQETGTTPLQFRKQFQQGKGNT